MLDVLDAALAQAKADRRRKRDPALPLTRPVVLGQQGTPHHDPNVGLVYLFTVRQCQEMRETILAAARADAGLA